MAQPAQTNAKVSSRSAERCFITLENLQIGSGGRDLATRRALWQDVQHHESAAKYYGLGPEDGKVQCHVIPVFHLPAMLGNIAPPRGRSQVCQLLAAPCQ